MTDSPKAPAGWYDDPDRADARRYWDGQRWTEHAAPGAGPGSAAGAVPPSKSHEARNVVLVVLAAAVAVGLAVGGFVLLRNGSDATSSLKDDAGTGKSAREIALLLDCTGALGEDASSVSCETESTFYGINTFESKADLDDYVSSAAGTPILVGKYWEVDAPSVSDLGDAQKILGGKVVR